MKGVFPTVLLGAGCFWGKEYHLSRLPGVVDTQVGFAGGNTVNPSYREVCSKTTGHAEVVRVTYDPNRLSLRDLLIFFFTLHDSSIDRRDRGGQYRSAIFFEDTDENMVALSERMVDFQKGKGVVVTADIMANVTFYPAEERHQGYCDVHGFSPRAGKGILPAEWADFPQKERKC